MAIQSEYGGFGALQRAVAKAKGVTSVQAQGSPHATQHLVSAVDDGAHGNHDYDDKDIHPAVLGRFKAHGARLDEHDDRIARLETSQQANLGSPLH